ncbi:MAG: SLBB domain-containing protein [Propionibacteriaceae bacterium]|nr:SLBB domain-containing protein [Propionibacteriaceae bacterium]
MDLSRQIFEAGVIGAGGAGFPTYKKLTDGAQLLVVNAAECEPLLASDRYLMRHRAAQIVAGAQAVAQACGIPRIVIGTKSHYAREIAALTQAIEQAGAAIEIHGVDSFYPAGDEQVLVYEITGRTVPPGGIPLDIGVIVINVTTASNIAAAIEGTPVTRRFVTVTGEVAHPTIVDAPVGATAADLIQAAGGTTVNPYVIVRGGPMMGKHASMDDAPTLGYGKADGGLIVLPADHPLVQFMAKPVERLLSETKSICIQCQMCTSLCPRYLIGHQMRPHRVMRSLQTGTDPEALTDALLCCECGICELYSCPMGLSPRRMNIYVKGLLRAQGIKVTDKTVHPEQSSDREYRRVAQARFIDRLQLSAYPTQIDDCVRLDPAQVRIPTRHGVGMAARPCVSVGDVVGVGQLVAEVGFGDLGAPVHASIAGRVTQADENHITIVQEGAQA